MLPPYDFVRMMRPFLLSCALVAGLCCLPEAYAQKNEPAPLPWQELPVQAYSAAGAAFVAYQHHDSTFVYIQTVPRTATVETLRHSGIRAEVYLGKGRFAVRFPKIITAERLSQAGVTALLLPIPTYKLAPELRKRATVPARSDAGNGNVWVVVEAAGQHRLEDIKRLVSELGGTMHTRVEGSSFVEAELPFEQLGALAEAPFLLSVSVRPPEDVADNYDGVIAHRANLLQSRLPGGRALDGRGIMVGVGDGGFIPEHLDLRHKLTNLYSIQNTDHPDHVSGTIAGSGIINPEYAGMAPKATMIADYFSNIIGNAVTYKNTYGMVLTNNSYGFGISCPTSGTYSTYTSTSSGIDEQVSNNLSLIHCFAASNDGAITPCGSRTGGFGTISLGYGGSKNAVVVGAVSIDDAIAGFSSRGPVADGRVKPDVCAVGTAVMSTIRTNTYGSKQGTSMATPGTTGSLALMYQRYRQLNSNQNPDGALLKALLMNSADDIGNSNVDYRHGYGRININRAVEDLEAGRFVTGTISQGGTATQTITVPAGTSQIKVMLYWHDYKGATSGPGSFKALVNDLDLTVTNPASTVLQPWVLDPTVGQENTLAFRGTDTLNNAEQVTVSTPASGTYTITVNGTEVPMGPQRYYLVWEAIQTPITLTHPIGGEVFQPGTTRRIRWESPGFASGSFTIALSTDGGSSYTNIVTGVSASSRWYNWAIPAGQAATNQARIRVTYVGPLGGGVSSSQGDFTIMGTPTLGIAGCDGAASLTWPAITGATGYKILRYNGVDSMITVGTTSANAYPVAGLVNGQDYWFSVQALTGTYASRRSTAIKVTPGTASSCPWTPDVGVNALLTPVRGRSGTSQSLSSAYQVQLTIKNFGNASVTLTSLPVKYRLGSGPVRSINYTGTLTANTASSTLSFAETEDLSAAGTYVLKMWTELSGDYLAGNDTLTVNLINLANPVVSLPYTVPIASMPTQTITANTLGLNGLDAADYSMSGTLGRMRMRLFGFFGSFNTFTLDRSATGGTTANFFDVTVNLSTLGSTPLALDFDYANHGEVPTANDKVWARGTDTQSWVQVYDLGANQSAAGTIKQVTAVNIRSQLTAAGQTIGGSFQIRFGQEGDNTTATASTNRGYTFANIRLYNPGTDLRTAAITAPAAGCLTPGLKTVTINVQNLSSSALTNVPVYYRFNNGTAVAGSVPSIGVGSTVSYSFPTQINVSSTPQTNTLMVWVGWVGPSPVADNNPVNDTLRASYLPTISSFPFHDGFEGSTSLWRAYGTASSWQWGALGQQGGALMDTAANGNKVWATSLYGNYSDNERSYLESPCLNLSGAGFSAGALPQLSFNGAYDTEVGYDSLRVEYSLDGTTWTKIPGGTTGYSNWYNYNGNRSFCGTQSNWTASTAPLPSGAIGTGTRIRFAFFSDVSVNQKGVYLDDIHLDRAVAIHKTGGQTTGLTQTSTGSGNWMHFVNGSGERVVSIQDVVAMGTVTVGVLVHSSTLRQFEAKPYGSRNWQISVQNQPGQAVPVLLYVTQAEIDQLTAAEPVFAKNFQKMRVSKYNGPNQDFDLLNNTPGTTYNLGFAVPVKRPFADGYALEVSPSSFSEFRFGPFDIVGSISLPVRLLAFNARAEGAGTVRLDWRTTEESRLLGYRLERSEDGRSFYAVYSCEARNRPGIQQYGYRDEAGTGKGLYYRLRMLDADGHEDLSPVVYVDRKDQARPVVLAPNPATDRLNLLGEDVVRVQVLDALGRVLLESETPGTGIDVSSLSSGFYQARVVFGTGEQTVLRWQKL